MSAAPATARLIVVPVIRDEEGRVLVCKMAEDRGVFPGSWALPGGGVEPGESLVEALRREIHEELGARLVSARPLFFREGVFTKTFADGSRRPLRMVFLLHECRIAENALTLNEEFTAYAWARPEELSGYELNEATKETFATLGLLG